MAKNQGVISKTSSHPAVHRSRKPVGALVLLVFLAIDSTRLHLLHHLLGSASSVVVLVLVVLAVAWGIRKAWKR